MTMRVRWLLACLSIAWPMLAQARPVLLFDGRQVATIVRSDDPTMRLAADLLAHDLAALSGRQPQITDRIEACGAVCVVFGRHDDPLVGRFGAHPDLAAQWETYTREVVRRDGHAYVVIAGADRRGAIYGVVDLSRQLGVSPWEWWADVAPRRAARLAIDDAPLHARAPSVRYRGIFLNDEDWGLEPWAARTLDPATGNIGPKTYARVFELMWRLKANLLWPAMHAISTPFYADPANPKLAEDYAVVIGTSHAEPMLRNNLREWDAATRGPFDFTTNAAQMADYWRERLSQARGHETIYTLGLRGIHDGPMQGATDDAGRRAILEKAIGLQRGLLGQAAATAPQVYIAYHELQDAYDGGLAVPADVTLMWTDDNYGYLRRLDTPAERKRPGGAGIYYHLSYWGRPHDYLWLGTTHPALIREEMGRAFATDARRMWVVNVGDIKPIEYLTQYFLDLAFDAQLFDRDPRTHLRRFMADAFGPTDADALADIMLRYYDLAFERRPEFMGFGQTEWVAPNRPSAYVQADGEEAHDRIAAYADLVARAEAIAARIPADRRDAFFELVLYPVRAAAGINARILNDDLATLAAGQGRASANVYSDRAQAAQAALVVDTARYNALAGGKWRGMMDMAPRTLPVFQEPLRPHWSVSAKTGCGLAYWGDWVNDENTLTFVQGRPAAETVRLFGYRPTPIAWRQAIGAPGLSLSATAGTLSQDTAYEQRLTLHYDGIGAVKPISIACGDAVLPVPIRLLPPVAGSQPVEQDRRVTLPAAGGTIGAGWQVVPGLGSQGASLRAALDGVRTGAAVYRFASTTATGARIGVVALPTHPLAPGMRLRAALRIDGGPERVLDFATIGRSDVWREAVLANHIVQTVALDALPPGAHRLEVTALDPGLLLDRIDVEWDGARPRYGAPR